MRSLLAAAFVLMGFALDGCGGRGTDWSAPESMLYREHETERAGGALLEYWSILDVPCASVFDALADVEHFPDFIPGVDRVSLVAQTPASKTVQIAQRVIGRQVNAKVTWTFDRDRMQIDFHTLQSDLTYNDGHYQLEDSPDHKRCAVQSSFLVKEDRDLSVGALSQATRETFMAAAHGVRRRAAQARSAP